MINLSQMKTSIIKKNSKNYKITTQAYIPGSCAQNNYKTVGSFNNNFISHNTSSSTSKKLLNSQINKINSNEKNLLKKTKIIIKKQILIRKELKMIINIWTQISSFQMIVIF